MHATLYSSRHAHLIHTTQLPAAAYDAAAALGALRPSAMSTSVCLIVYPRRVVLKRVPT